MSALAPSVGRHSVGEAGANRHPQDHQALGERADQENVADHRRARGVRRHLADHEPLQRPRTWGKGRAPSASAGASGAVPGKAKDGAAGEDGADVVLTFEAESSTQGETTPTRWPNRSLSPGI